MSVKPLLAALAGTSMKSPPIWLMRQAGRYLPEYREVRADTGSFLDLCYTPERAAEVTLQPIRRFGFDAAIIFSDILVIPDALGQKVSFQEGEGPILKAVGPEKTLSPRSPEERDQHLAPVYEALKLVKAELHQETALIGFAGAPWTIATYMVEGGSSKNYLDVKRWAYGDPEGFAALIDELVDAIAQHLCRQIEAGADVVQIFDSWAGVLPQPWLDRYSVSPIREIVSRVKLAHKSVPVIVFPKGAASEYPAYLSTGADALGLDASVNILELGRFLQSKLCVQGNLDPALLVTGGNPMRDGVNRILDALGGRPFVFNLGHGVVPETPPGHVAKLVELVRKGTGD